MVTMHFSFIFNILLCLLFLVQQFDFHMPSLTVLETLHYQAKLRIPRSKKASQSIEIIRSQRVNQVIHLLDLTACAHIFVGNEQWKGISGGEKRRLSIGIQLLSNPPIGLLDEPTTGLDAFTARNIMMTLKAIVTAKAGATLPRRTLVLSIHQPRYDIFAMLDHIILLSRGQLIFSGSSEDMLSHFMALKYPCPILTNPADFILDLSSIDVSLLLIFIAFVFHYLISHHLIVVSK
jgi:ATP-binding cassette, subfamily G (WHITE), member 8 (sterolin 2)